MDKSIEELLKYKDEQVVQFNLINTTSSDIYVNLFNTDNLNPVTVNPIITSPANSQLSSTNVGIGSRFSAVDSVNQVFITNFSTNFVDVYDENNNLVTSINIGLNSGFIRYNPINDTMYVQSGTSPNYNSISLIKCSTYTFLLTFTFPTNIGVFDINTSSNIMYVPTNAFGTVELYDCNNNTIIGSVSITGGNISICTYNSNNNCIYTNNVTLNTVNKIDCNTNTYIPLGISLPSINSPFVFNPNTNKLYGSGQLNYTYFEIDTTTDTLINLVATEYLGLNAITCAVDYFDNILYVTAFTGNLLIYNLNSNTLLSNVNYGFNNAQGTTFSPNNRRMYISTIIQNLFSFTTVDIYSTSYYIQGSSNYNLFVNSLNSEPIFIQLVRIITQNQNQLTNQLQLTTIDSTGFQTFKPNFPINQVDVNQDQGNIGEVRLENQVFDGRTYVNQYKINPYENVSLEIYYKQLNLSSATPYFPILFKPKVQLKEYIKRELNL